MNFQKSIIAMLCLCTLPLTSYAAVDSAPTPLVSNGEDTPASEYRDYLIHYIANDISYCTGQLIHPRFILTNVHCMDYPDPYADQALTMHIELFGGMTKFNSDHVLATGVVGVHRLVHGDLDITGEYLSYLNQNIQTKINEWTEALYGSSFTGKLLFENLAPELEEGAADLALIELNQSIKLSSIALPQRTLKLQDDMTFDEFAFEHTFATRDWVMRGFGSSGYDDVPDPTVLQQFYPKFVVESHQVDCTFYEDDLEDQARLCEGGVPMVNENLGVRITPRIEAFTFNEQLPVTAAQPGDSGSGVYELGTDNVYSIATHRYNGIDSFGNVVWANGMITLDHVLYEMARRIDDIAAPTDVYLNGQTQSSISFSIQNHTMEPVTISEMLGNREVTSDCGESIAPTESCLITVDYSNELENASIDFTETFHFTDTAYTTVHVQVTPPTINYGEKSGGSTGLLSLLGLLVFVFRRSFKKQEPCHA